MNFCGAQQSLRDPLQRLPFGGREMVLHAERAMSKQGADLLLHPLPLPSSPLSWTGAGASPRQGRLLRCQPLTLLSDGPQHGLCQCLEHRERAELMRHRLKDLGNRLRIQGRRVGGDRPDPPAAASWQLRDNGPTYWAVLPPSITISDPVMKDDSSEAR
jgi:hypothetical protein